MDNPYQPEARDPRAMQLYFQALNVLHEKWVLHTISVLMAGPIGFNELARLAQQVNTTTLSQRLQLLENQGILTRTVQSTIPPKTSYELTPKGRALKPALDAIWDWALQFSNFSESALPAQQQLSSKFNRKRSA
jgi:DNA-binding HxlR family transcriptional regulator